jgi:hypothetical protein
MLMDTCGAIFAIVLYWVNNGILGLKNKKK